LIRCNPKKTKKKKTEKEYIDDKIVITKDELEKIKKDISKQMTDKVALILLCGIADEMEDQIKKFDSMMKELKIGKERGEKIKSIFRFDDEMMCNTMVRVDRYATYVEEHLVDMKHIRDNIEKHTGIKMVGW